MLAPPGKGREGKGSQPTTSALCNLQNPSVASHTSTAFCFLLRSPDSPEAAVSAQQKGVVVLDVAGLGLQAESWALWPRLRSICMYR